MTHRSRARDIPASRFKLWHAVLWLRQVTPVTENFPSITPVTFDLGQNHLGEVCTKFASTFLTAKLTDIGWSEYLLDTVLSKMSLFVSLSNRAGAQSQESHN